MKPRVILFVLLIAVAVAAAPLAGQVKITQAPGKVDVEINGKPFTTFYAGGDEPKPYLHPLRTQTGKRITRLYPMEKAEGETKDHPHHRGLWFTHGDVNKIDYWMNEPATKGTHGPVVLKKIEEAKGGKKQGTIKALFLWKTAQGQPIIEEKRTMTFVAHPTLRIIDFDVAFFSVEKVTWGDTKEGFFAIRLRDELTETKGTGKITNSEGATGMKNTWGKKAKWVDYSGTLEGEKLGVAIFDHPENLRHPTYWHVRDYGLFAANPFGLHDFMNDKTQDGSLTVNAGDTLRLRYRVVIHPGDTEEAGIKKLYTDWALGLKK